MSGITVRPHPPNFIEWVGPHDGPKAGWQLKKSRNATALRYFIAGVNPHVNKCLRSVLRRPPLLFWFCFQEAVRGASLRRCGHSRSTPLIPLRASTKR